MSKLLKNYVAGTGLTESYSTNEPIRWQAGRDSL